VGDLTENANNQNMSTTEDQSSPIVIRPLSFSPRETEHTSSEHYCDPSTVVESQASDIQANSWMHEQRNQLIGELSVPSKDGSAFKKFST